MPRCPDCSKFVSLETETEPEVDGLDVDDDGTVTCSVRIVNCCGECSAELTETTLELQDDCTAEVEEHLKPDAGGDTPEKGHTLSVEEVSSERTQRVEGKGRGAKTFYGASVDVLVKCECGWEHPLTLSDDCQASSMDEMN